MTSLHQRVRRPTRPGTVNRFERTDALIASEPVWCVGTGRAIPAWANGVQLSTVLSTVS